jgi:hypothetical protein
MDSLVNRDAASAIAPTRPVIAGPSFQPVFSIDGLVLGYTATLPTPFHERRRVLHGQAVRLVHDTFAFFQACGKHIPISLDYGDHFPRIGWSAAEVCALGGLVLNGNELCADPEYPQARRLNVAYPASLATFHAPLVAHLHSRSQMFAYYAEFNVGLRIRLTPTVARSGPTSWGAVQVTGLHLRAPAGFSEFPSLRSRFCILLERASQARLPVLVSRVDDAADLHWMRIFSGLKVQGDALSPPMSADCLAGLLALGKDDWRSFRVGGRYP